MFSRNEKVVAFTFFRQWLLVIVGLSVSFGIMFFVSPHPEMDGYHTVLLGFLAGMIFGLPIAVLLLVERFYTDPSFPGGDT